jgi:hypothetical protein
MRLAAMLRPGTPCPDGKAAKLLLGCVPPGRAPETGIQARLEAQRAAELAAMAVAADHVRTTAADAVRRALSGPGAALELKLAELSAAADAGYTVVHFTDLEMTSQAKARVLVMDLIASIRAGQQGYRPPLLWPRTSA